MIQTTPEVDAVLAWILSVNARHGSVTSIAQQGAKQIIIARDRGELTLDTVDSEISWILNVTRRWRPDQARSARKVLRKFRDGLLNKLLPHWSMKKLIEKVAHKSASLPIVLYVDGEFRDISCVLPCKRVIVLRAGGRLTQEVV